MTNLNDRQDELIDRIKALMKGQDINQTQLAKKSGITQGTMNRLLNKKIDIQPTTLEKIAGGLGITLMDLCNDEEANTRDIAGYVEYDGEITKIKSLAQLEKLVNDIKYETAVLPKEVREIRKQNRENATWVKKFKPNAAFDYNIKDFRRVECYDATKLDVWGFKTADDHKNGITLDLGNQCSGYGFQICGHYSPTSENAYLCGQFSMNTAECQKVQEMILSETNGFAAKKYVRNRYTSLIREDWPEMNAEWMLYVIWQKCKGNKAFADKLKSIPADAIITENSTTVNEETNKYWGTLNPELEKAREKVARYTELKCKKDGLNKAETAVKVQEARDEIQYIGTYTKGMNFMGKVLKQCQLALLNGTEPDIDYELLRSKHIFFMGKELTFDK